MTHSIEKLYETANSYVNTQEYDGSSEALALRNAHVAGQLAQGGSSNENLIEAFIKGLNDF